MSKPASHHDSQMLHSQVLILGTGIAGLSTALKFAKKGFEVLVVCKANKEEGSTRYAQGGIASVWSNQDSFESHQKDTLVAGAGLCNEAIVELCVKEGPPRVQELIDLGVAFTQKENSFDLHREGGHSERRILHANDLTGWAIEKALLERVSEHSKIRILEHHIGIDLITEGKSLKKNTRPGRCLGAYVLNTQSGNILTLSADITVLATGGAAKVYMYTSNPDVTTGDGIAMAYRAGAKIANLEFMQFHPTCLYHPGAKTFLISEALRGEGAILRTIAGEDFMPKHHPLASLAPRDIVARAIDIELKRTGDRHVVLDCRHLGIEEIQKKFPHIYQTCLQYGIDITREPIPVVPAAHYTCGGVRTDENAQTSIEGLYAVGEVACSGLHGANRLASNSLLEAVVFAHRAAEHGGEAAKKQRVKLAATAHYPPRLPEWDVGTAVPLEEQIDITANWFEIRRLMWDYVGIVRSNRRLERARRRLETLKLEITEYYWSYLLTKDLVELRNLLTVAELIVRCATLRKESRGLHFTVDYPDKDNAFKHDTVV